ncbi:MAG: hypothetical protein KDJ35_05100 [Alphaproteobacteria bacterium]|nr:hypothetical protein [Alphaproteobacteria bacterium]
MGDYMNNKNRAGGRHVVCLSFLAAVLFLCPAAPAHAFTSFHGQIDDYSSAPDTVSDSARKAAIEKVPSSPVVDSCLPLLKSIHTSSTFTTDRTLRTAGKSASAGLIFGVRFALSPTPKADATRSKARFGFWHPTSTAAGGRPALALRRYQDCRSDQAFDALNAYISGNKTP